MSFHFEYRNATECFISAVAILKSKRLTDWRLVVSISALIPANAVMILTYHISIPISLLHLYATLSYISPIILGMAQPLTGLPAPFRTGSWAECRDAEAFGFDCAWRSRDLFGADVGIDQNDWISIRKSQLFLLWSEWYWNPFPWICEIVLGPVLLVRSQTYSTRQFIFVDVEGLWAEARSEGTTDAEMFLQGLPRTQHGVVGQHIMWWYDALILCPLILNILQWKAPLSIGSNLFLQNPNKIQIGMLVGHCTFFSQQGMSHASIASLLVHAALKKLREFGGPETMGHILPNMSEFISKLKHRESLMIVHGCFIWLSIPLSERNRQAKHSGKSWALPTETLTALLLPKWATIPKTILNPQVHTLADISAQLLQQPTLTYFCTACLLRMAKI